MADRKLETMREQVLAVYAKVRAARQAMDDIVEALDYRDPDKWEFDKMWETLTNMEDNLEQTLEGLKK